MSVPQARPRLAMLLVALVLLPVSLLLSARAGGARITSPVAGDYTCVDGPLDALRLTPGGRVRVTATLYGHRVKRAGTYDVMGGKVSVRIDPPAISSPTVFTRSGDVLDAGLTGRCTRR